MSLYFFRDTLLKRNVIVFEEKVKGKEYLIKSQVNFMKIEEACIHAMYDNSNQSVQFTRDNGILKL